MQNILRLFAQYGVHLLFIVLQIVCFTLVVTYNQTQRSIFLNSSNVYVGSLNKKTQAWSDYLALETINDSLARDNGRLMETFINNKKIEETGVAAQDTQYQLTAAKVINNTYQLRNNHLTIDKGTLEGIQKNMGVISSKGIVGIVRNVSPHYAHVISILNTQSRISATVKPHAYPGTLMWKGSDPNVMSLEVIPKYADISVGDTVVTNGYSTVFPEGIVIGTIDDFSVAAGTGNYKIKVKLINDIPNEDYVFVINNTYAQEQKKLESPSDE